VPQVSSSLAVPVCEGLQASLGHVASSSALVTQYTTQAQALPQPTNLTPQKRPYAQPDHLAYVAHAPNLPAPTPTLTLPFPSRPDGISPSFLGYSCTSIGRLVRMS
jgi:hypothetical protein